MICSLVPYKSSEAHAHECRDPMTCCLRSSYIIIAGSGEALFPLTELGSECSPVSQLNSRGYFGTAPYSNSYTSIVLAFMQTTVDYNRKKTVANNASPTPACFSALPLLSF